MAGNRDLQRLRAWALERIEATRVAGHNTRHSRADNLLAVRELVNGHPHYTFGIRGVNQLSAEEVLRAIAGVTGCSKDLAQTTGGGYISPRATLKGLEEATRAIVRVAERHGRFVLGTGHPGSLLLYYVDLARLIEGWGGQLIQVEAGAFIPPHFDLEYVEGVAVISDRNSIWHTHDPKPMEIIISAAGDIDLAVVDHGFAAGAINAGIPAVTILDTNDPALAVARRLGAEAILIPMDDNRPLDVYQRIVEIVGKFGEVERGELAREAADPPREEVVERLAQAERMIREKMGDPGTLAELVDNLAESYKDQFIQTHFDLDREEALAADPYVVLAVYLSLHDALDRFIEEQIAERGLGLTPEEIDYCLRRDQR